MTRDKIIQGILPFRDNLIGCEGFRTHSNKSLMIHDKQGWPVEISGRPAQIAPRKRRN